MFTINDLQKCPLNILQWFCEKIVCGTIFCYEVKNLWSTEWRNVMHEITNYLKYKLL